MVNFWTSVTLQSFGVKSEAQMYATDKGEMLEAVVAGVDHLGRVLLQTKKGQTQAFDLDSIRWVDPISES